MKSEYHLPYCVYILLSLKDDNFYVGYTTDLLRLQGFDIPEEFFQIVPREVEASLHFRTPQRTS